MDSNEGFALFQMKFQASIKKLEELLTVKDIQNAATLLDKMQHEAKEVEINALDGFSDKVLSIRTHSIKKIKSQKSEFEPLLQKFLEGCEAILHNQFKDEKDKKETLELLSVHDGMARYKNDAKVYREELVAFSNWLKGVYSILNQLIKNEDILTLLEFIEELKLRAQRIEAKEIIHFVSLVNQSIMQEQTQCRLLLESYQKSIKL
ncbi:MAG: hypothetical protein U9N49_06770 [Campylobacterota bacterium]|nr:hypothetical protein [Campylobacterota bacterium]